jgi:hypothetical protein
MQMFNWRVSFWAQFLNRDHLIDTQRQITVVIITRRHHDQSGRRKALELSTFWLLDSHNGAVEATRNPI